MRANLFLLLALVLLAPASAQGVVGDAGVYVVVDESPAPVGGMSALLGTVAYPEAALDAGAEGLVFVTLVVDPDGTPRDVTAARAPHPALAEAARDAVAAARFTPGRVADEAVPTRISLPVRFALPTDAADYADQPAAPLGGWGRFVESIEWPTDARRLSISATYRLSVDIDASGETTRVEVERVRPSSATRTETRIAPQGEPSNLQRQMAEGQRRVRALQQMDRAVRDAAEAAQFVPEIRDGEAVAGRAHLTLPFIVRD